MKVIIETQSVKREVGKIINWGDQVDIIQKCTQINDEFEITFIRCSKIEFESMSIEEIKEKAEIQKYLNVEFLHTKIENQSKVIDLLIEILEEEDEQ